MILPRRDGSRRQHAHHAFADRGHLRPPVVVHDGGDDVPAERRPDLQQQFFVDLLGPRVGESPICKSVQSAVMPARISEATRGARSRPRAVAPKMTICGLCF